MRSAQRTVRSAHRPWPLKQAHGALLRAPASGRDERRALTATVDSLQSVREVTADPPQAPLGCAAVFSMCRQAVGVQTAALSLSCIPPPHPSTALSCLRTLPNPRRREGSSNFFTPGNNNERMQREQQAPLPLTSSKSRFAFPVEVTGMTQHRRQLFLHAALNREVLREHRLPSLKDDVVGRA